MDAIDTQLLRKAVDIASGQEDSASLNRISTVYKVLTPGQNGVRVTIEDLAGAGYVPVQSAHQIRISHPHVSGTARYAPDMDELVRLSYAFGLEGTKKAPAPGWAEFERVSSGLHMLCPQAKAGKKLRNSLDRSPDWCVESHVPRTTFVAYTRTMSREEYACIHGSDELYDGDSVSCEADHPNAVASEYIRRGQEVFYLRPRRGVERPRMLVARLPGSAPRPGREFASLNYAWSYISRMETFVIQDGTRLEVRDKASGALDGIAVYSLEKDGWSLEDGSPLPEYGYSDDLELELEPLA